MNKYLKFFLVFVVSFTALSLFGDRDLDFVFFMGKIIVGIVSTIIFYIFEKKREKKQQKDQ